MTPLGSVHKLGPRGELTSHPHMSFPVPPSTPSPTPPTPAPSTLQIGWAAGVGEGLTSKAPSPLPPYWTPQRGKS